VNYAVTSLTVHTMTPN